MCTLRGEWGGRTKTTLSVGARALQIWTRHSHLPPTFIEAAQMDSDAVWFIAIVAVGGLGEPGELAQPPTLHQLKLYLVGFRERVHSECCRLGSRRICYWHFSSPSVRTRIMDEVGCHIFSYLGNKNKNYIIYKIYSMYLLFTKVWNTQIIFGH